MQLPKILLVGLVSFYLLSSCSLFNRENGSANTDPLIKVKNKFIPNNIWSASVGHGIGRYYSYLRPAYQNNTLFAADRYGIVKAIDTRQGYEKWKVDLTKYTGFFNSRGSAMLSGGLAVSNDKIYIGSEKAIVYALNTSDGSLAWHVQVSGEVISLPVISNGTILIHTSNGQLQALNELDGALKWTVSLDSPSLSLRGESALATDGNIVVVGGDNGYISAVLLQQGQLIWKTYIAQPLGATEITRLNDIDSTPVIVEGIIYALGYNGNITAIDLYSGHILWQRVLSSVKDMIVDKESIYIVDYNDRLLALKTKDGQIIWTQDSLLHRKFTSPVILNGYLVTGDDKGYLHWINADDGHFVTQNLVNTSGFLATPLAIDDKIVIQARDGTIYAFTN